MEVGDMRGIITIIEVTRGIGVMIKISMVVVVGVMIIPIGIPEVVTNIRRAIKYIRSNHSSSNNYYLSHSNFRHSYNCQHSKCISRGSMISRDSYISSPTNLFFHSNRISSSNNSSNSHSKYSHNNNSSRSSCSNNSRVFLRVSSLEITKYSSSSSSLLASLCNHSFYTHSLYSTRRHKQFLILLRVSNKDSKYLIVCRTAVQYSTTPIVILAQLVIAVTKQTF